MISLHPTQPSHADDIAALLDRSFGPGFRARTAERLREANQPISALSYIARDDQEALIGSISYWPVRLDQAAGLLLGPLAVDTTVQGKGVGLQLMGQRLIWWIRNSSTLSFWWAILIIMPVWALASRRPIFDCPGRLILRGF